MKNPKKTKKVGRPKLRKDLFAFRDDDWKLFSKAAKASKQIGGEVNMRVTKTFLMGNDQIVVARFSKTKGSTTPI